MQNFRWFHGFPEFIFMNRFLIQFNSAFFSPCSPYAMQAHLCLGYWQPVYQALAKHVLK